MGLIHFVRAVVLWHVGWFACVLGEPNGMPWAGPVAVAIAVGAHFLFDVRGREPRLREACAVLLVTAWGVMLDATLVATGRLDYGSDPGWSVGFWVWIVALWANFAVMLNVAFPWFAKRPVIAAVLAGVFGPLTYRAGAALGLLAFPEDPAMRAFTYVLLAVEWAILFPVALDIATSLRPRLDPPLGEGPAS